MRRGQYEGPDAGSACAIATSQPFVSHRVTQECRASRAGRGRPNQYSCWDRLCPQSQNCQSLLVVVYRGQLHILHFPKRVAAGSS